MFETTKQISNLSEVQKKTDPLWGVHTSKRKQQQQPNRMAAPSDVNVGLVSPHEDYDYTVRWLGNSIRSSNWLPIE